jgi:hypothetical protein
MRNQPANSGLNLTTLALLAASAVAGVFLWNKSKASNNAEDESKNIVDNEATRIAAQIKFYLGNLIQRPNVEEIIKLARAIKDWPAVVTAYSRLYAGENLEATIRKSFQIWGGYQEFLTALSKKGLPGTSTDNIVVKPAQPHKKGDKILIDDSAFDVVYFKDWKDYPTKPLATVTKGRFIPSAKTVTFIQALEAQYAGSTVKTLLYQIQLGSGLQVWVNRNRNIAKTTVKGLGQALLLNIA